MVSSIHSLNRPMSRVHTKVLSTQGASLVRCWSVDFVSIRFSQWLLLLDEARDAFLRTLVYLSGYWTVKQAQKLGLINSPTRVTRSCRRLRMAASCGISQIIP